MPRIFLEKTDLDRKIAQAIRQLSPGSDVLETDRMVMVSGTGTIRFDRSRLEQMLGEQLDDQEWSRKFGKATGEVRRYDEREFVIEEEPPGDY